MKKISKILIVVFAIIVFFTTKIYASSIYIEEVGKDDTTLTIDKGEFRNEITKIDKVNNEVEIELNVKAEKLKEIKDNTEIVFLIDDSGSMNAKVNSGSMTRKTNVINSTKKLIESINENNKNIKMGIVHFSSSAYPLSELTNDKDKLLSSITTFGYKMPTGNTAMATGLKTAKSKFSKDANNKIIILLTDGMPTEDYQTVRNSLQDDNVYIISVLVGLENATKDEKRIISVLFGTEEQPVPDKVYNITDDEVEDTITKDIYEKVIDSFKETIKDINIENKLSNEIVENFDIKLNDESNGHIEDNKILWNIEELESLENESLKYTLTLKEDFNENIIDEVLDTSENIQIEYKDIENSKKIEIMESVPQIMLKQDEEKVEEPEKQEEIKESEEEIQEEVEKQIEEQEEIEESEEEIQEEAEEQIEKKEKIEKSEEEIQEEAEEQIEKQEEIKESEEEIQEEAEEQIEKKEKIEKTEQEKEIIEEPGEIQIEENKQEENTKIEIKETKKEEKTMQTDNTTANKVLAYTGTDSRLIIVIGIVLMFVVYEGIKLIKVYKKF